MSNSKSAAMMTIKVGVRVCEELDRAARGQLATGVS